MTDYNEKTENPPPAYNEGFQATYSDFGNNSYGPYPQPPPPPPPPAVIYQPAPFVPFVPGQRFHSWPVVVTCVNCRAQVTTETRRVVGLLTWMIAGAVLLMGCWLGCCLIPFCIDPCKDVIHICPNCKTVNGRYSVFD